MSETGCGRKKLVRTTGIEIGGAARVGPGGGPGRERAPISGADAMSLGQRPGRARRGKLSKTSYPLKSHAAVEGIARLRNRAPAQATMHCLRPLRSRPGSTARQHDNARRSKLFGEPSDLTKGKFVRFGSDEKYRTFSTAFLSDPSDVSVE